MEICAIPLFDGDSTIISYFQAFCAGLPVGFQWISSRKPLTKTQIQELNQSFTFWARNMWKIIYTNLFLPWNITLKWVFRMVEDIQTYLACSNFSSRAAAFAFNRSTWKQMKRQKSMRLKIGHILSILIMSNFQSSVCLMLSDVVMRLNAWMHLDMPMFINLYQIYIGFCQNAAMVHNEWWYSFLLQIVMII